MSWPERPPIGLLLLTGGEGKRFGAPKHLQPHPLGGTWAGHLVGVFDQVFSGGPIQVLGAPIPERQELENLEDPRLGPAQALAHWAGRKPPATSRWWVVACDQIHWTVPKLGEWVALVPGIAATRATSLRELADSLPCLILPSTGAEWLDVDRLEDLVRLPGNAPWAGVPARTGPRPPG